MIVIETIGPYQIMKNQGIDFADGTIAKPEVQLVDEYGKTYELDNRTYIGNSEIGFWRVELPTERPYLKVRLRSNQPIECKRMIWRCQNWK